MARERPFSRCEFLPDRCYRFPMSTWTLWLLLAVMLVLPVLLRLYVGEEPGNETSHEQGDDEEDGRGGPAALRAAA